ncbi:acyltransferase [uncultured Brevundimonas sp.]|uniref:acyltransferase family protein n=1 Tax=uncultured Brevundimonas sp. TaxID=213418 RepID=UPI0030EC9C06|tara:strand:+ start:10031 stop:11212 length:1182 start_codon:yes stop_codon:yes gene_type:complete
MSAVAQPVCPSSASRPSAIRGGALDALRFVAALFVVVFHFGDEAPVALATLHDFLGRGYLATDFFLMLSGFVLAKAYGDAVATGKLSLGRFWARRFVRCYPTHIITLALLAAMVGTAGLLGLASHHPENFQWSGLPAQVLLLHAFGLGGGHWNIPSWTISALLICYAFFPMLWRRMLPIRRPGTALGLGLFILVAANLTSLAVFGTQQFDLPFQWAFFRAAPLFLVGLTLARAVQTAAWSPVMARSLGFGGAAVLLANAALSGPDMINILAICAVVLGCGASPVTRPLPGAEWGARVSFSLFMIHTLTGAIWFGLVIPRILQQFPAIADGSWLDWGLWFGGLASTLIAATLYHHWIDAPLQRRLNGRLFGPQAGPRFSLATRPDRYPAPEPSA